MFCHILPYSAYASDLSLLSFTIPNSLLRTEVTNSHCTPADFYITPPVTIEAFCHILPYSAIFCLRSRPLTVKLYCPQFTLRTEFIGLKNRFTNLSLYHGTTPTGEPPVLNQTNYFEHIKRIIESQSYAVLALRSSVLSYNLSLALSHTHTHSLTHTLSLSLLLYLSLSYTLTLLLALIASSPLSTASWIFYSAIFCFPRRSLRKLPPYSISMVSTPSLSWSLYLPLSS